MQYSIVKSSKVGFGERIDADYFRPDFLKSLELVESHENVALSEIAEVSGGKRLPLGESFSDEGVPYVRAEDVKNGFVQYEDSPKISFKTHEILKKYQTKKEDVLLTIVGNSIGDVGLVKFDLEKCNLTENCVRIANRSRVRPEFLFAFLLSKHGQIQIHREKVGTAQPKLALERIRRFKIPIFSKRFQETISEIINHADDSTNESKSLYKKAEGLLLSELGLGDLSACGTHRQGGEPARELSFVKNFSDTQEAERFDAEYFQPKYERMLRVAKQHAQRLETLGNIATLTKSVEPGSDAYEEYGVPFVRVSNLSKFGLGDNNPRFISEELYDELKLNQPKKGEILLSKDATPGIAYYLDEKPGRMIVSGGIVRLKLKDSRILPEYLTLVLNSSVVQAQIERDAGGSIITHWRPDQIRAAVVPVVSGATQKKIKSLVERAFHARRKSRVLLALATRGVELALEKTEREAEKWLESEREKIR